MMTSNGMKRYLGLLAAALLVYLSLLPIELAAVRFTRSDLFGIDHSTIAETLTEYVRSNRYPDQITIRGGERVYQARVVYTLNPTVQDVLDGLYRRYRPDYAAFIAIDPVLGNVIALSSWDTKDRGLGNLVLRNSYPAASVFKIVTAAAALDMGQVEPDTVLPFNGKRTSLYKRQVLRHRDNKWTRRPTLTKAFAESVNPVFARLGVYRLGAEALQQYSRRFGFNRQLNGDLIVGASAVSVEDDEWSLAEVASGFNRTSKLSPWHGAMLASAVANDGVMVVPHIVKELLDEHGIPLYIHEPHALATSVSPDTAQKLRRLMMETVRSGSARSAFKRFFRGHLQDVEVGGKTGSLTGLSPKGRNDWFVGYALLGNRKIAFASLTINEERWKVKSAYVARKVIEAYFDPQ